MFVNVLYQASATVTGTGDNYLVTTDSGLEVDLSTPKELGGGGGAGANPEQLLAVGYAASLLRAIRFVASEGGPAAPPDAAVTATVGVGPRSQGGFGFDIGLDIALPGVAPEDAQAMVQRALLACPYSNAMRDNVPLRLVVT